VTAAEWAFVTIAWLFGFLPGVLLGSEWGRASAHLDRLADDDLVDLDGFYVDRGRIYRKADDE
jgi:hypothetical protein